MAQEKLTLLTEVKGATQAAREVGKLEGAIDRVGAKASGLRGKIGGFASSARGLIASNEFLIRGYAGDIASRVIEQSNAGTGGAAGVAGNVLGGAAGGAATAGLPGAFVGAAAGIAKSAVEIGEAVNKQTDAIVATGKEAAKSATLEELNASIAGIDKGLADLTSNGLNFFLGGGDAAKKLVELKAEYQRQRDTLMQEGADTERALRNNANAIVQAIGRLDVSPTVSVNVSLTSKTVEQTRLESDRYGGTYVPGGVRGF